MKKIDMQTLVNYINANEVTELYEVRDNLLGELNRGAEKAQANKALYDAARDVVLNALSDTDPATVAEIFEAVKDELPEGFTKAKVQYALGHYWESDVNKVEGKVNAYTRKA